MPDNTTEPNTEGQPAPDFNLLRKSLSRLAKNFDLLNKASLKTTKSLSKIAEVNVDKLQETSQQTDTRVPAVAPSDYPSLQKNNNTSSPVVTTVQSQTTSSSDAAVTDKAKNDTEPKKPSAKPPTFITKMTERLRDTFENVTSKATVSKDSFMYKTMERVGNTVTSVKEKLKDQPKINKILESSSGALTTIKEKLKDQPTINKVLEKSSTALGNIKDNLKEQPKKLAESAVKFGKEGWQEQKEMNTPLMKVIAGVKELGKGNITGAAKQVMSAKDSYNKIQKPDSKKEKTNTSNPPQTNNKQTPTKTNTSTDNTTPNITGIQQFNEKLDESSKKLDEWSSKISDILNNNTQDDVKIKTSNEPTEKPDEQSKPAPNMTQSTDEKGLRRLDKPKPVRITNVDEIAKAIQGIAVKTTGESSGKGSGVMMSPGGEESSGGMLGSILGGALSLGKAGLKKAGGLVKSGAKGVWNLGKKAFGAGKSLLGKGVNMAKNLGGKAGKLVSGGVSKVKNLAGGAAKKVGGFFSKMWGGAKSLGSKAIGKVKSVGSSAMKLGGKALGKAKSLGKSAISGVKKVASKLNPVKAFKSALGKIPVGKLLAKVVKLPIIGSVISGVLAASEVKDILADPSKSEKDKRKEVGKVVGKSIAGIMGGAIAAGAVQILNAFPGLGVAAAPLAYLGGDFIGSSIAGFVMNNVSGIDEKIGDITGKVFKLDFKKGSKTDKKTPESAKKAKTESKKIADGAKSDSPDSKKQDIKVDPLKAPDTKSDSKQSTDKPIPDTSGGPGFATPELSKNEPVDKEQLLEQNPQMQSEEPGDNKYETEVIAAETPVITTPSVAAESTGTEPVDTKSPTIVPIPTNNTAITPEEASKTNIPVIQGVPLSKNQPNKLKPNNVVQKTTQSSDNNIVDNQTGTTTAADPVKVEETSTAPGIQKTALMSVDESVPKQIGTAVAEAIKPAQSTETIEDVPEPDTDNTASTLTSPPGTTAVVPAKKKMSLLDRVKAKNFKGGSDTTSTQPPNVASTGATAATGGGILAKGLSKMKSGGGKLKDKTFSKIDSMTPWYVPKASTMVKMSKSKLGRKGLALAGGYALKKAKNKIGDTASAAVSKGKDLLGKVGDTGKGLIKKAIPKPSGGFLSKIGDFISSPGKSIKGAMSALATKAKSLNPFGRSKSKPTKATIETKPGSSLMSRGTEESIKPGDTSQDRLNNTKIDYSSTDALLGIDDKTQKTATPEDKVNKPKPTSNSFSDRLKNVKMDFGSTDALMGITDKAKTGGKSLLSKAKGVGKSLGTKAKSLLGGAGKIGSTISDRLKNVKMDFGSTDALMGITDKAKTGGKSLGTKAKSLLGGAGKIGSGLIKKIPGGESLLGKAAKLASGGISKIKSGMKGIPTKLKSTKGKILKKSTPVDSVEKSSEKKPGLLTKFKKSSAMLAGSAVAGATAAKEKAKSMAPGLKEKWREGTTPQKSDEKEQKPGIISNSSSSSSTNTTVINRYDTDTISRWRSKYIDDQHKPGHYSLFS